MSRRMSTGGTDKNASLLAVARSGDVETARRLIRGGARIDTRDALGQTPLMIAVYNEEVEMIRFLKKSGASLNLRSNDGFTPYELAVAEECDEEVIEALLENTSPNQLKPLCEEGAPEAGEFERDASEVLESPDVLRPATPTAAVPVVLGELKKEEPAAAPHAGVTEAERAAARAASEASLHAARQEAAQSQMKRKLEEERARMQREMEEEVEAARRQAEAEALAMMAAHKAMIAEKQMKASEQLAQVEAETARKLVAMGDGDTTSLHEAERRRLAAADQMRLAAEAKQRASQLQHAARAAEAAVQASKTRASEKVSERQRIEKEQERVRKAKVEEEMRRIAELERQVEAARRYRAEQEEKAEFKRREAAAQAARQAELDRMAEMKRQAEARKQEQLRRIAELEQEAVKARLKREAEEKRMHEIERMAEVERAEEEARRVRKEAAEAAAAAAAKARATAVETGEVDDDDADYENDFDDDAHADSGAPAATAGAVRVSHASTYARPMRLSANSGSTAMRATKRQSNTSSVLTGSGTNAGRGIVTPVRPDGKSSKPRLSGSLVEQRGGGLRLVLKKDQVTGVLRQLGDPEESTDSAIDADLGAPGDRDVIEDHVQPEPDVDHAAPARKGAPISNQQDDDDDDDDDIVDDVVVDMASLEPASGKAARRHSVARTVDVEDVPSADELSPAGSSTAASRRSPLAKSTPSESTGSESSESRFPAIPMPVPVSTAASSGPKAQAQAKGKSKRVPTPPEGKRVGRPTVRRGVPSSRGPSKDRSPSTSRTKSKDPKDSKAARSAAARKEMARKQQELRERAVARKAAMDRRKERDPSTDRSKRDSSAERRGRGRGRSVDRTRVDRSRSSSKSSYATPGMSRPGSFLQNGKPRANRASPRSEGSSAAAARLRAAAARKRAKEAVREASDSDSPIAQASMDDFSEAASQLAAIANAKLLARQLRARPVPPPLQLKSVVAKARSPRTPRSLKAGMGAGGGANGALLVSTPTSPKASPRTGRKYQRIGSRVAEFIARGSPSPAGVGAGSVTIGSQSARDIKREVHARDSRASSNGSGSISARDVRSLEGPGLSAKAKTNKSKTKKPAARAAIGSSSEVRDYLRGLQLQMYSDALIEEGFDNMQRLKLCTPADLDDLGIAIKRAHKRQLIGAINRIR